MVAGCVCVCVRACVRACMKKMVCRVEDFFARYPTYCCIATIINISHNNKFLKKINTSKNNKSLKKIIMTF